MAYETKVILRLLASQVAKAENLEEAYDAIATAASVEGMKIPDYKDEKARINKKKEAPEG